jgi:hypothetical protein
MIVIFFLAEVACNIIDDIKLVGSVGFNLPPIITYY